MTLRYKDETAFSATPGQGFRVWVPGWLLAGGAALAAAAGQPGASAAPEHRRTAEPCRASADSSIEIVAREKWSGVFTDAEVTFAYTVKTTEAFDGLAGWALAVGPRTVARGELPVNTQPAKPAEIAIPLRIPHVKEGVIVPAELRVSVYVPRGQEQVAHAKPIYVFPRDSAGRW